MRRSNLKNHQSKNYLMSYRQLIYIALLSFHATIWAQGGSSGPEISVDSVKSGVSIAEVGRTEALRFQKMDKNGDNLISLDEFKRQREPSIKRHQYKKAEKKEVKQTPIETNISPDKNIKKARELRQKRNAHSKELFNILDKDRNASLSYKEFLEGTDPMHRKLARLTSSFKRLDKDKDGMLSTKEMLRRVNRLKSLDTNQDGFVEPKEMPQTGSTKHSLSGQKKQPNRNPLGP